MSLVRVPRPPSRGRCRTAASPATPRVEARRHSTDSNQAEDHRRHPHLLGSPSLRSCRSTARRPRQGPFRRQLEQPLLLPSPLRQSSKMRRSLSHSPLLQHRQRPRQRCLLLYLNDKGPCPPRRPAVAPLHALLLPSLPNRNPSSQKPPSFAFGPTHQGQLQLRTAAT